MPLPTEWSYTARQNPNPTAFTIPAAQGQIRHVLTYVRFTLASIGSGAGTTSDKVQILDNGVLVWEWPLVVSNASVDKDTVEGELELAGQPASPMVAQFTAVRPVTAIQYLAISGYDV